MIGTLGFIRHEETGKERTYNREELLTQFDKSEKIATEVEFVLPPKEVPNPLQSCGAIEDQGDGEFRCHNFYFPGQPMCIEHGLCPAVDRGHYQNILQTIFDPSRSDIDYGKKGFGSVKKEGSIPHGLEVTTVGRRIVYKDLLTHNQFTTSSLLKLNCTVNWRCGLHFHYLLGYYPNGNGTFHEAQCTIPIDVLANVWQLCVMFADSLFWLGAAGDSTQNATRYMKFRRTPYTQRSIPIGDGEERAQYSLPNTLDLAKIRLKGLIREMSRICYQPKYSFVNLLPAVLGKSDIETFHLEFRFPDATLSSQFITIFQILCAAIVKKAISLSEFGILVPEKPDDYYGEVAKLLHKFCGHIVHRGNDIDNKDFEGNLRKTINDLTKTETKRVQERTKFFLQFLKEEINAYAPVVYTQLMNLVDEPIFKLREKGLSWEEIDSALKIETIDEEMEEFINGLYSLSALHIVPAQTNLRNWADYVANLMDTSRNHVLDAIRMSELHWDRELGACIRRH